MFPEIRHVLSLSRNSETDRLEQEVDLVKIMPTLPRDFAKRDRYNDLENIFQPEDIKIYHLVGLQIHALAAEILKEHQQLKGTGHFGRYFTVGSAQRNPEKHAA